jgi:hypothetical protein
VATVKYLVALAVLTARVALAQPSPSPSPAPPVEEPNEEIARALAADAAAQKKSPASNLPGPSATAAASLPAGAPVPSASAPEMATQATRSGSGWASVGRFFQSLNPDIAAILDTAGGYYSDENVVKSGDDPAKTGFTVQEIEVALQAVVDPPAGAQPDAHRPRRAARTGPGDQLAGAAHPVLPGARVLHLLRRQAAPRPGPAELRRRRAV